MLTGTSIDLKGPGGLKIELRATQVFPNDPGQGTPVLVVSKRGNTATLSCALGEGELDGESLTDGQLSWLSSKEAECDEWLDRQVRTRSGRQVNASRM